jgi:hypothetical protein
MSEKSYKYFLSLAATIFILQPRSRYSLSKEVLLCTPPDVQSHYNAIAISAGKSLLAMPGLGYANALIDVLCSIQRCSL